MLTLENYIERYMPLNILKIIQTLMSPLLEPKQYKKFEKYSQRFIEEQQSQILSDIGSGSIFDQIIKVNEEMTERLNFRVDLQEELMRKENGEIFIKKNQKEAEPKRLSKQDIKLIIAKKMTKVRQKLETQVMAIQAEGKALQENIDVHTKGMEASMKSWQKEQEQYQHNLHSELLLLNDTKKNVTQLNEQIRLLVTIQKKT